MGKINITREYAREFDGKCARVDAHGFLKFVTEKDKNNISILDLIKKIGDTIVYQPSTRDRDITLDEEIISSYLNEFFSKYMPGKAEEVKQILDKSHPYFIDKDGGKHVNFIPAQRGDPRSSNVGHSGRNTYLEFNVYVHGSIDDLRATAHELSHALSSHHKHTIDLIRSNAPHSEIENYTRLDFKRDCVGEIESHITEKLFNKYLLEKGIYTKEDIDNYNKQQQASLLNEVNLIREERDILRFLSCPVTFESLNELVENLDKFNQNVLMDRVGKMHDDQKCSSYMFRYIVGRVVADQWIKKFDELQDEQAKEQMLKDYQNFLDKTHELNLDSACENLLGKNFACVVEDYANDKVDELDDEIEM